MRVPVATVLIGLIPALAVPQSLGDAAQRQATRRATEASAPAKAKLYRDADLRREAEVPGPLPAVADATEAATADTLPPPSAVEAGEPVRAELDREAEERKQQEQHWRQASGSARARLASAQRQVDEICGSGGRVLVLTGG
jgi:hypothetical protein